MEKFTKEEKELLERNPNIQAVLSNQILYTKDFKEKAVIEYESGKSANREKINIHYPKKKCKQKKSAYQKLLERNKGARGIRRIKMDLEDIYGKNNEQKENIQNYERIKFENKEINIQQ